MKRTIAGVGVLSALKPTRKEHWKLQMKGQFMSVKMRTALPKMLLLSTLAYIAPASQAGQCSLSGTAGNYGLTLTGTLILPTGPVPIAAVVRATLDAAGNATGTESRNVGGGFADETFSGTYTVSSDCTGTATINFYESGQLVRTSVLSLIFDHNQREVRMVQKSLQLPNGAFLPIVATVEGKRIFIDED
jgi:hypothetical protein